MKYLKFIVVLLVLTVITACKDNASHKVSEEESVYKCPMQCEGNKTYAKLEACPVCKMDLVMVENQRTKSVADDVISDESIFNLTTTWHTEEGSTVQLKDLKGKTLVMVMIYTTCKAACPRLVADMRNIEAKIPKDKLNDLQFVLVSIDPKNDTPARLKAFAKENFMDGEQWTFLQGTESGVREFANVLAVKYKQISPLDFSHSNIISVFNSGGELVHQQEGLGVDNKETVDSILKLVQ
ncbi:SCO family protein [Snuella sedimenti]|uniref:SCO family protein n=1 Tax=Snuella sedimenti TaxID=2798802 RepID=A0A8J7LXM0_9FLAO|nr:SCO family protein [Snuella sedimenti]MBJ6366971.1 SCO family protein [Snuella sedimenti]